MELTLIPFIVIMLAPFFVVARRRGWISQWLIVANMLIFGYMLVLLWLDEKSYNGLFDLVAFNSKEPLSLGLFTSMFVHADLLHILGNMLVLYFIGVSLEERIGTPKTAVIYVATGIISTTGYALLLWGQDFTLVGASGAVSGLMGAILVLYPRDEIGMIVGPIFLNKVPVWIAVGAFFGMEVFLTFITFKGDLVAHAAHVIGLIAGIALGPVLMKALPSARKAKDNRRAISALLPIAKSEDAMEAVAYALGEEDPVLRKLWLDKALALVSCPECGGRLTEGAGGVHCKTCDREYPPEAKNH